MTPQEALAEVERAIARAHGDLPDRIRRILAQVEPVLELSDAEAATLVALIDRPAPDWPPPPADDDAA